MGGLVVGTFLWLVTLVPLGAAPVTVTSTTPVAVTLEAAFPDGLAAGPYHVSWSWTVSGGGPQALAQWDLYDQQGGTVFASGWAVGPVQDRLECWQVYSQELPPCRSLVFRAWGPSGATLTLLGQVSLSPRPGS